MTTTTTLDPDLRTALKRLKLGKMLDTLPERIAIAKQQLLAGLRPMTSERSRSSVSLRVGDVWSAGAAAPPRVSTTARLGLIRAYRTYGHPELSHSRARAPD